MYLIPKNIKVKREIFKGIGIIELIFISANFGLGFFLQSFFSKIKIKIFIFFIFPLLAFLLILPLPNGATPFIIFRKFLIFQKKQKKYKYKYK